MNTGVQQSAATPVGAWTTTTPAAAPRAGQKKDIARILSAHGIPYVATLASGFGADASATSEPRSRGPPSSKDSGSSMSSAPVHRAGGMPTDQSVGNHTRLAVESRYFPLFACDGGNWSHHLRTEASGNSSASSSKRKGASDRALFIGAGRNNPSPCRRTLELPRRAGDVNLPRRVGAGVPSRGERRSGQYEAGGPAPQVL